MEERSYSSYTEWYREGPFSEFIQAWGMAGKVMSVIEATQPAGDLSDPPIDDLVLIRMLSSDASCAIDLGAGKFCVDQQPGDFILVAPDTRSDIRMYTGHSVQLFSLPRKNALEMLADQRPSGLDFGRLHAAPFRSELLEALCRRLVDAARRPEPASRLFVDGALMTMLGELGLLAGGASVASQRDVGVCRGGLAPHVRRRVMEYAMSRLTDDVCLGDLAAIADLSPNHFHRAFKQSTGLPPHAWLTSQRVEQAQRLILAQPALGLTEVALSVGYSTQAAFGVAFKRVTGLTPGQWRAERVG